MKETPILFSEEMDRAIQEGRKTMTRRILKIDIDCSDNVVRFSPYGGPGDLLWQKEPFRMFYAESSENPLDEDCCWAEYLRDGYKTEALMTKDEWKKFYKWKDSCKPMSSLFMFKSLARKWYEIVSVRVERLQDITPDDCIKEGIDITKMITVRDVLIKQQFIKLWNSINKKRGPWESNPWVWVVEFKKIKREVMP